MNVQPPRWTRDQLEADRQVAIGLFREQRFGEPVERYREFFRSSRVAMENLLELTDDLRIVRQRATEVMGDPDLAEAARYLASPPISRDDLETIAEVSMAPRLARQDPSRAERLLEVILEGYDRERFPWMDAGREPTESEKDAAILASAVLRAVRRAETSRRTLGKREQEAEVKRFLVEECGLAEAETQPIPRLSSAPPRGHFTGETLVGSRNADVPVVLWDGRLMPVECKVSNSATNSYKRINNDAAVKAVSWRREFGDVNCVPAAVLSGVFSLSNLEYAQQNGLAIFWAHDLEPLRDFIDRARD